MNERKYVLHPGYVTSKADGDRHYINAKQLADLYRIKLTECHIIMDDYPDFQSRMDETRHLIHLYPRFDGDYVIPSLFR